jgi:hypothetical protein
MSKKITQKLKEILSPEDLKVFEGAIESMIVDRVNTKLESLVNLKEEELKKKYDKIAEDFVKEEVEKRSNEEKTKLVETYDTKLANLEKKIVSKLDSFLEQVIVEQISDELLNKIAINETLLPVVNNIKKIFTEGHIELDSEGENIVKDLSIKVEKSNKDLSESIAKCVALEGKLEKASTFLMISEKTSGLTNTDKKQVVEMFKDKKFDEVEKKIDDYIVLIKEGTNKKFKKATESKKIENVISENDKVATPKKTVIKEEIVEKDTLSDFANKYLFSDED